MRTKKHGEESKDYHRNLLKNWKFSNLPFAAFLFFILNLCQNYFLWRFLLFTLSSESTTLFISSLFVHFYEQPSLEPFYLFSPLFTSMFIFNAALQSSWQPPLPRPSLSSYFSFLIFLFSVSSFVFSIFQFLNLSQSLFSLSLIPFLVFLAIRLISAEEVEFSPRWRRPGTLTFIVLLKYFVLAPNQLQQRNARSCYFKQNF